MLSLGTSLGVSSVRNTSSSSPPPDGIYTLNVIWTQPIQGESISDEYVDLPAGTYQISIDVSGIYVQSWEAEAGLGLYGYYIDNTALTPIWYSAASSDFLSIFTSNYLGFTLSPNLIFQNGTAYINVEPIEPSMTARIHLFGVLPTVGDGVHVAAYFIPV
jgi:hypothetical protein